MTHQRPAETEPARLQDLIKGQREVNMCLQDLETRRGVEKRRSERDARGGCGGWKLVRTRVNPQSTFHPLLSHARWFSLRTLAGLEQHLASVSVLRAADGSESNICTSKRVKRH